MCKLLLEPVDLLEDPKDLVIAAPTLTKTCLEL